MIIEDLGETVKFDGITLTYLEAEKLCAALSEMLAEESEIHPADLGNLRMLYDNLDEYINT